jgi:hypothetical protein
MACLLNAKTEKIYDNVFNEFKKLIKYAKISIDYSKLKIMSDFELTLRKSIRNNFNESELMGCYFHFIKNLYAYFKKLGLCNKRNLKNTLKFLFFFKIFPFIKDENKIQYIKDIVNFYITDNEYKIKYYKFIKYFIKNWFGIKIMSYESLTDEDIRFRTDNIVENFHKKLNSFIDCHKPKLSFFVSKYKSLIMTMNTE